MSPMCRTKIARLVCVAVLVAVLGTPSSAAPVRPRAITFQGAEASWLVRRGDDIYMYFVMAFRLERPMKGTKTRLFVDRSKCRVHHVRGRRVARCSLEGRMRDVASKRFRMPAGLGRAELRVGRHRVVWRERSLPTLEAEPWVDAGAILADIYVQRRAAATGRLFGTRMAQRTRRRAVTYQGADAGVVHDLGMRSARVRVTATVRF